MLQLREKAAALPDKVLAFDPYTVQCDVITGSRFRQATVTGEEPGCLRSRLQQGGTAMSSYPRVFDPLDLEIIDRVYDATCVRFEASNTPFAA